MAGSATLSRGNVLNSFLLTVNLTPVSVAGSSTIEQTFTIPGTVSGDQVSTFSYIGGVYPNSDVSFVNGRVAANNTLTIAFQNGTGGALVPPAGNYLIELNRAENLPMPNAII